MSSSHDDYLYRQVLQSVIHPLGAPGTRLGYRPPDLARHLTEVFGFGVEKRQSISSELQLLKPSNIVLSVQLVEARNLKPNYITDSRDPYCILGVVFAKTPRPSPHSSPNLRMRRKSSYQEDIRKSQAIKGTVCPKWQEEFQFDVQEYYNQALHVIIWDDTSATNPSHDKGGNSEKTSGIKSLFRQLRSSIDQGRGSDDIIGQCRVPLKDIPAGGCDQWFDLYEDRKQKVKRQGQLRLRLQLSIKQEADQLDSAESDQCSMEDYYHIVRKLYIHALKALSQQAQLQKQHRSLDGLSDMSSESTSQQMLTHCKSCDVSLRTSRRFSDTGQQLSPPKTLTQCQHSDMELLTSLDESVTLDRCSSVESEPMSLNCQSSDSLPRLSVKSKSTDSVLNCPTATQTFSDMSQGDTMTHPCATSTPVPHHFSMTHLNVRHRHQRSSSAVELRECQYCGANTSLRHQCNAPDPTLTQHCDVSLVLLPASPDVSGFSDDHQTEPPVLQCLPSPSQSVLLQFSVQNHFSKVTQVLMELIVIMELVTTTTYDCVVSDSLLREKVTKLEAELSLLQPASSRDSAGTNRGLLTSTELTLFSYTATTYVTYMVERIRKTPRQVPMLFPPNQLDTEAVDKSLGVLSRLLNLRVWACNKHALQQVTAFLTDMLQNDVRSWVQSKLDTLHSNVRDPVIPETKLASLTLYDATMTLTPIHSVAQYFDQFDIDYFRLASLAMESKLATRAQELMHAMDSYQLRYHKFLMNIRESSKVSLQFYLALKDFLEVIRTNINPRELFKVSLANYQSWFKTTVIFWLQTFRDVCIRRMEKALEIEKDVVQVTCLVKYSNSSVDVLSCFTKIITEWMQINFADPDIALLGVTKITDTICDGAVQYAEKIEMILEKNGFYDFIDNQQFDVTEQLCISLNNIEHVRQFLDELHQLLDWNTVTQQMALKHESEEIGQKALTTLEQLVDGANEDMLMKSRQLLRQIADKMTVDLQAYFAALMKSKPETAAIDPLLDYLDTNLGMFYERLEAALFPLILEHIWDATIEVFHEMLLVGQSPEYYKQMLSHLQLIEAYFNNEGTSSSCWTDSSLYGQLVEKLQLNSLSSEQLMLLYYKDLAESPTTPREYYGHLGVKIGFISKTADCVSLHIKVLHASHLPTMKPNGMCDAYVTVSLGPSTLFPFNRPMRTQVVYGCSSPLFHEIFQFKSIPRSLLSTEGTVVVFSVWQHKTFLPHDFLGEVILSLSDATEIGRLETIDDTCGVMMPLKRPVEPQDGPFQVLRERCQRDKVASSLVKCRRSMAGGGRTLCAPMHFILSSVCGNIKNVKHVFS